MFVPDLVGDEGAAPLVTVDEPFVMEKLHGLAHGHARDFEFSFELLQRGDLLSQSPLTGLDAPAQSGCDLDIKRNGTSRVRRFEFRHASHSICTITVQSSINRHARTWISRDCRSIAASCALRNLSASLISTAMKRIARPGLRRATTGMSAEMTVAIFG